MKLWIIYDAGSVFSKVISEMLQDRLENYIDVSVGKVSKIDPSFIIEEELDYLIIGDIIRKIIPSVEIQEWVLKYREISESNNLCLEALSGFLIALDEKEQDTRLWEEFMSENILTQMIYPSILCLSLKNSDLNLETNIYKIVKEYANQFAELIRTR